MDTTKIDEFISELEYPYYEVKVLSILRRGDSIHELIIKNTYGTRDKLDKWLWNEGIGNRQ